MDFSFCLRDAIEEAVHPSIPTTVGVLTVKESAAITSMPGGQVIHAFFDGEQDKRLLYQYAIKCKADRIEVATAQLWAVTQFLEELEALDSRDGSFQFDTISITSQPAQSNADEAGFYYHTVDFSADVTTFPRVKKED
ncbi:hypothetical protein [Lacticaseibacillus daqingensis]|uniref:hypothetical protein n=1 Tax=Lacticaseibacillus daqingensis TaxID=2486014 RepID=UPI000F77F1B8|nr:hypothetical protein [Lacticaseibacillus daqingensis]